MPIKEVGRQLCILATQGFGFMFGAAFFGYVLTLSHLQYILSLDKESHRLSL
jgi:hypothetical protein